MNCATLAINDSQHDLEDFEKLVKSSFNDTMSYRSTTPIYSAPSYYSSYYYNPYRTGLYSPYYSNSLASSRYGPSYYYGSYSPYYRSSGLYDTLPDYYYYGSRPYSGLGYYDSYDRYSPFRYTTYVR